MINTVGLVYLHTPRKCIYLYKQIAVYFMNGNTNLHFDLKKLILINICEALLISNFFLYFDK